MLNVRATVRLCLLLPLSLAVSGCWFDGAVIPREVGVRLEGAGIVVGLKPCIEPARTVLVQVLEGDDAIWRIEAPEGSVERQFVIGRTPNGFDESVPLEAAPAPRETYVAQIEYKAGDRRYSDRVTFTPEELTHSRWKVAAGEFLSQPELDASDPCN